MKYIFAVVAIGIFFILILNKNNELNAILVIKCTLCIFNLLCFIWIDLDEEINKLKQ